MYSASLCKAIRGKGLIERVVAMCGDVYPSTLDAHDDGRVIEVARARAELDYIADLELIERRLFGERTLALVADQKVI